MSKRIAILILGLCMAAGVAGSFSTTTLAQPQDEKMQSGDKMSSDKMATSDKKAKKKKSAKKDKMSSSDKMSDQSKPAQPNQ